MKKRKGQQSKTQQTIEFTDEELIHSSLMQSLMSASCAAYKEILMRHINQGYDAAIVARCLNYAIRKTRNYEAGKNFNER